MIIPGFRAEASLYRTSGHYRTMGDAFRSHGLAVSIICPTMDEDPDRITDCPIGYSPSGQPGVCVKDEVSEMEGCPPGKIMTSGGICKEPDVRPFDPKDLPGRGPWEPPRPGDVPTDVDTPVPLSSELRDCNVKLCKNKKGKEKTECNYACTQIVNCLDAKCSGKTGTSRRRCRLECYSNKCGCLDTSDLRACVKNAERTRKLHEPCEKPFRDCVSLKCKNKFEDDYLNCMRECKREILPSHPSCLNDPCIDPRKFENTNGCPIYNPANLPCKLYY